MAEQFLEINAESLFKVIEALKKTPEEIRPALASAVNKTMDSTVTQIKKEVAAEYTVKQKYLLSSKKKKEKGINGAITKKRATVNNLSAAAIADGGQVALYKFQHTPINPPPKQQYRQPVRAQVKKSGSKKLVTHNGNKAFVQTVHKNNMLFAREGKKRFPIKKLFALSVPQMIASKNDSKGSLKRIKARAEEMLEKKVEQEINYRIGKLAKKKM